MLDDAKQAQLVNVLGGLSSEQDRERAAAAVDKFVREKLGLTWADVAEAISAAHSLRDEETAPRADTEWYEIRDSKGQLGYGRWCNNFALTVRRRKGPRGRQMWFASLNGRPLRDGYGVQLYELLSEAQEVATEAAGGE